MNVVFESDFQPNPMENLKWPNRILLKATNIDHGALAWPASPPFFAIAAATTEPSGMVAAPAPIKRSSPLPASEYVLARTACSRITSQIGRWTEKVGDSFGRLIPHTSDRLAFLRNRDSPSLWRFESAARAHRRQTALFGSSPRIRKESPPQ